MTLPTDEWITEIRHIISQEIQEQLHIHQNRRSFVVYGLPEDNNYTQDKLNSIFELASIPSTFVQPVKRLGKPNPGYARPLQVDLRYGIPVPYLRDLAEKMKSDPLLKHFHVRRLETTAQRRQGYLDRMKKRNVNETDRRKKAQTFVDSSSQTDFPLPEQISVATSTCDEEEDEKEMDNSEKIVKIVKTLRPELIMDNGYFHPAIVRRGWLRDTRDELCDKVKYNCYKIESIADGFSAVFGNSEWIRVIWPTIEYYRENYGIEKKYFIEKEEEEPK